MFESNVFKTFIFQNNLIRGLRMFETSLISLVMLWLMVDWLRYRRKHVYYWNCSGSQTA